MLFPSSQCHFAAEPGLLNRKLSGIFHYAPGTYAHVPVVSKITSNRDVSVRLQTQLHVVDRQAEILMHRNIDGYCRASSRVCSGVQATRCLSVARLPLQREFVFGWPSARSLGAFSSVPAACVGNNKNCVVLARTT